MSQATTKLDLHGRLKKHAFQHALIATYNFGSRFFEDYALETFKALQDNGNVTVLLDGGEYDDLLHAAAEHADSFPKQANLRYLLHPIRVPGVFHPKVFLFAGKKRGLLLIGSANFTQDGLGSNAELVSAFDYEEGKNEAALPLFVSALRFFEQVAERWPSEPFESNLRTLTAEVPWLSKGLPDAPAAELPMLLSNLERPLWDQLVERLPGRRATEISVLSRFFDAKPSLVETVASITGTKQLTLYTQNGITTLTEAWLAHPLFVCGDLRIRLCSYADDGHFQHLHGKAYAFTKGKMTLFAMGSANFTTAALSRTASNGNVEVLLCYPPVTARQFSPKSWFDPSGTAVVLKKADQLITASENADEPTRNSRAFQLRLTEALVDENCLRLRFDGEDASPGILCSISQGNSRPFILHLAKTDAGLLCAKLDAGQEKRLCVAPAIAELGTGLPNQWKALSNPLFVTNLLDIATGRDVRRERQIREARESPQRFMDVLMVLSRSDDEERLKQFLTYCDIPMDLSMRLYRGRSTGSTSADRMETLRMLGARNLRHFEALHEAVMDFVARHRRRLDRHVESGTAKGIPNFLHILLTIGNLLLSQIERVVVAFEAESKTEMRPERWHLIRNNLDAYYHALEQLLQITAVEYLDSMLEIAPREKVCTEFSESLPDLKGLYERATKNRDVLDALRQTRLAITNSGGGAVPSPGFFNSVLTPAKWEGFLANIAKFQQRLTERLVA
ncbi:MAG: hypothetical protein HZA91_20610 [Verrucomicrobia bacterium]|nr:hypothetical protein [Verrucomicrobiota bacterium]